MNWYNTNTDMNINISADYGVRNFSPNATFRGTNGSKIYIKFKNKFNLILKKLSFHLTANRDFKEK
jgi:hypothetical protein